MSTLGCYIQIWNYPNLFANKAERDSNEQLQIKRPINVMSVFEEVSSTVVDDNISCH